MAEKLDRLAQVQVAGGGAVNTPAVPVGKGWLVSSLIINNQIGADDTYSYAQNKSGEADADSHYLAGSTTRGRAIRADQSLYATVGYTLNAGGFFVCRQVNAGGSVVFTFEGKEVDQ